MSLKTFMHGYALCTMYSYSGWVDKITRNVATYLSRKIDKFRGWGEIRNSLEKLEVSGQFGFNLFHFCVFERFCFWQLRRLLMRNLLRISVVSKSQPERTAALGGDGVLKESECLSSASSIALNQVDYRAKKGCTS